MQPSLTQLDELMPPRFERFSTERE